MITLIFEDLELDVSYEIESVTFVFLGLGYLIQYDSSSINLPVRFIILVFFAAENTCQ